MLVRDVVSSQQTLFQTPEKPPEWFPHVDRKHAAAVKASLCFIKHGAAMFNFLWFHWLCCCSECGHTFMLPRLSKYSLMKITCRHFSSCILLMFDKITSAQFQHLHLIWSTWKLQRFQYVGPPDLQTSLLLSLQQGQSLLSHRYLSASFLPAHASLFEHTCPNSFDLFVVFVYYFHLYRVPLRSVSLLLPPVDQYNFTLHLFNLKS